MGNGKGAADDKVRRRDCRQNKNTTKSRVFLVELLTRLVRNEETE